MQQSNYTYNYQQQSSYSNVSKPQTNSTAILINSGLTDR